MSPGAFLFGIGDRNRIDKNSSRILSCDLFPIRKVTFDSADQQPPPQEEPHRVRTYRAAAASGHYRGTSASNSLQDKDKCGSVQCEIQMFPDLIKKKGSEIRNNPLPSSVLQARARLVERLYLSAGTRQRSRTSCISWINDTRRQNRTSTDRRSRTAPVQEEPNLAKNNKPPGLDHNSVNTLPRYIFRDYKIDSGLSRECSICLEKFKHGDALMILPSCIHKFHHACLEPWITYRGDCPYCRTTITNLSSH